MIAVIILIGLALYEAILKKIQITFMHVIISTVILGIIGYSVYRFSYMITVWILLCFIWNYYHNGDLYNMLIDSIDFKKSKYSIFKWED